MSVYPGIKYYYYPIGSYLISKKQESFELSGRTYNTETILSPGIPPFEHNYCCGSCRDVRIPSRKIMIPTGFSFGIAPFPQVMVDIILYLVPVINFAQ